jgi:hypothetical protein
MLFWPTSYGSDRAESAEGAAGIYEDGFNAVLIIICFDYLETEPKFQEIPAVYRRLSLSG